MFTLKNFDFGIDAAKSSFHTDGETVTIDVFGAPESVDKAEDDDTWSFILYPPHFYFLNVPCKISESGDFSREVADADDEWEIGCYMLEHFPLKPCTVAKIGREIRVDAVLPRGLLSEPVSLTLRWQLPETETSSPLPEPPPKAPSETPIDLSSRPVDLGGRQATWSRLSHSGPAALFSGANSFTVAAYRPFLAPLAATTSLSALRHRAQWPDTRDHPRHIRWNDHADDLIAFIDATYSEPILAIGHSMGASASVLAAARRPELFRALVLIEPVLADGWQAMLGRLVPYAGWKLIEPVKSCLAKPDRWPERSAAFQEYRAHRAYRRIPDKALTELVDGLLEPHPRGGFRLAYPKAWEGRNYAGLDNVWPDLKRLDLPIIALRGRPSFFLKEAHWQKWRQRFARQTSFHELLTYGHLLPLEAPRLCAEMVLKALRRRRLI